MENFSLFELAMHLSAVFLAFGVVFSAKLAKELFGGIIGKGFRYIFIGVFFLALPHLFESLEVMGIEIEILEENHELFEHLLFYLGCIFLIFAFLKIYKSGKVLVSGKE